MFSHVLQNLVTAFRWYNLKFKVIQIFGYAVLVFIYLIHEYPMVCSAEITKTYVIDFCVAFLSAFHIFGKSGNCFAEKQLFRRR